MVPKYEIIVPKTDIDNVLYKYCVGEFRKGYIEFLKENVVMYYNYMDYAEEIENFQVRDTDVWIVTYPKCGTTWTQEMTWLISNNLDYEEAKKPIYLRTTFLEYSTVYDFEAMKAKDEEFAKAFAFNSVSAANDDKRNPRIIKTHLPWPLLPKALRDENCKAKIVYVSRNPKDTCVSYYHHFRLFEGYLGNFEDFCKLFLAGRLPYGTYWHMLEFWHKRNDPNILFLTFEEMKKDLNAVIRRTTEFLLNKQFNSEEIATLEKHLSFESMKNNPAVNYDDFVQAKQLFMKSMEDAGKFMRSGSINSYKAEMSPEIERRFDKWIEENTKNETDFRTKV